MANHEDASNAADGSVDIESLEESDDIRRIKEEWTRLHLEADDKRAYIAVQEAAEMRAEVQAEMEEASQLKRQANIGKVVPVRLPSLESMIGKVPSIPSMEIATGIGKRLPDSTYISHEFGAFIDLEPKQVKVDKTTYRFGADSPTQTDIKWSPPENAANFTSITYEIEVDGGQGWSPLAVSRLSVVRAYFTSNKILLAKYSCAQEAVPVALRLRVRANGTKKHMHQGEAVNGPWSEEIWLFLEGTSVTGSTTM